MPQRMNYYLAGKSNGLDVQKAPRMDIKNKVQNVKKKKNGMKNFSVQYHLCK